ncbi:hypothetical protein KPL71_021602 [Citrus sinensis]|uniref:Uncharacterized protein n=1 Tax=Citrus sinensis TaxID=2711 RepID=A0ACB8JIX7_CITSI|nr:hypothetical protein KPL71_021602 [Citrus sinensis]
MPIPEAQMFTSVFIIHRPYFQHPDTKLFWTQDQVYEWFTAPHIAVIENDIQDVLHNYLCQLNHVLRLNWRRENFSFMASPSSSTPVTLSSTLSLPKSCTSHTTNKIENLVEYSYIPESAQISESSYPLISPYHLYKRPSSFTRSIRTLISTRRPHPKEYIQSSRLDQCSLQATPAEQYVTLEIPSELISNWKREGYTHLHLGGIRLILTLHGRKGLPVTARLAMLDTRFKQYQDAVIGTVLTTLHAGSVLLTFYPNFNLSLQDPNLPTTLKVQIQIQGAEQISSAKIATLHHQLVYRLQNHALDLPTPEHHSDTLMVLAESDQIPTIIQIPRQIPRHELIKLMPLEWISNYEQFHNNTAPIQTSESMFERRQDGTVRMTFKPPPSAPQEPPRLSFTYSSMITAVQTAQEDLPITGFNSEGYPVYPAKHNGHFLWDAPGSGMCDPNCPCWDDWEDDNDYATTRKKKPKKKKPHVPCHHCDPKPPSDPPPPPAPLPIYRKELKWIAKHCKSEIPSPLPNPTPIVQPLACMMFSSTSSDSSSSFPSLEPHTDPQRNVVSKPFIPSPITSTGHLEPPKPFESVLNWQTQNARAQNDTLLHLNSKVENISLRTEQIETKVDSITAQMQQIYQNLQSRISQLDSELRAMLAHRYSGPEFDQKEREIRRLKAELAQIESEKQRPTLFTTSPPIPSISPTYHPFASMLSPIKQYDPSKLFGMTHTLFRDNPLPPSPKPKPQPRPQPRPAPLHPSPLTIPGQPSPSSTPASPLAPLSVPTQSKDKEPMHQFTAHTVTHSSTTVDQTSDSNPAISDSPTETDTESSVSTSDSEKSYADITKILMAQPDQPTQGQTSHTEPYVDIPSEMLRPGATTQSVLREFATRFTGALRDWFDSLGQYRQLQFVDLPEVSSALAVLHDQFLGDPSAVFEAARRDYLNMKCCSLNAKDLDFHYKRMSLLFYKLNGFNEPTLKHVFLASLPEELQPNIQRQLTASNLSLDNISLGKIFQLAKTCLDKLCEQKQFFKELLKDKEPFRSACKKPYLQIKCHKKKDCDCSSKKKRHFRKFKTPEFSSKPRRSRKPYRFFRKKSSSSREFKRKQSSRCFICKRKGHYAKDCPNKREKSIRLVEHLQATTDYSPAKDELEFYFSEQDEPNDETVFALQSSSDSDSDQSQVIFHQQSLSLDTTVPIPSIKLQILPSKFQRPIPAIGLIDTGAQRSMLNPHILPSEYWTQSEEHFKAVNGKLFTTSLITKKPIGIQIFPNCVIWTKVIGSTLPNKDILLGFDILHQIKHLQIIPTGIRVKSMFKPFTDILKLYNLSETPQSYQDISTKLLSFCPESHSEFTHPNPLWKNKSFFIKLPFKLNEDINPTKATHPGMSPSDLLLAQQECSQLLAQGLIEPTSSQWACQAFYVEKHSEIVRGKKRLVIDYQPLNMFLQDDKFPLPRSHDEHRQLLTQFYDVLQSHGIMLSAKKSIIATDNVEFLDFRRRENFSFMASTSSSTPSTPVTLSSTLSLPKSCTSHTANKLENLVEYSYIPESAQISESSYPLISPYQLYKRPSSFTRSIRTLISTRRPHPKEYIQSSRLDQCSLQATPAEQYVTLEIPSELISNWKREGYTHLHLGGIRLILTLHGRKGLPVTARLAMLDTRFKQYQDAVIGTVLTTLHAGSVLLTFYPNFNLSLQDPNLPTTLKVQIQIQGAEQISSAKIATLHHQLVYRLQNHALDLPTPEHHSDTLMVLAESDQIPTIIQIPRQIPRHELIKLMPLEWISNYEQFHNNTAPILTSESMFERRQDGTVRMTFKPPPSAPQEPPRLSFTYSSMITAVQIAQEDLPITGFNSEGYPVYPAKHNGHFLWDAPGSGMCDPNCPCWDDWEDDDDYATTRKKKPKKKKPPVPCHHCDPKPPSDPPPPPAPLPIYRKELKWIAKHCKAEIPSPLPNPTPIVQPLACMMFSSTSSDYSSSFPSSEPHTDPQRNVVSNPFIPSPITSTGHLEPPKPFESVLNWQTQNARAQNDTLLHLNSKVENISLRTEQIETKVDSITAQMQQIYQNLQSRISQLDSELRAMLAHRYSGPEFDQKEREIRRLKAELAQIESEKQRPTLFTTSPPIPSIGPTYHPFASMLSPIKQYDPSKLFGMTHTLFRDNPLPPSPKPKPQPRPQPRPAPLHPSPLTIPGQPSPSSTPASPLAPLSVPTQSKDKEPMHQFTAHTVTHSSTTVDQTSDSNPAISDSPTETDTESSVSTSDSEKSYADITKILMAQPDQPTQGQTSHTEPYVDIPSEVEEEMPESSATNQPPPTQTNPSSQKSSNGPWFTFDDLPSHKWRDRLNEMSAWIDLQMLRPGATTQSVLREFATRFTGALRDWFDSLGQYRQLQFVDLPEVSSALAVLHDQFLGDPSAVFEAARRDYLNMKCCSLNAKDLDFHYKRMSLLFYKLNGFNEPTLKHVFLASLPEELQPNIQRQLTASNLSLDNISLGKIFQLAKTCLDKLCEQKQFFKELLKDKEPFRSACKKPYLQIKCHKKKDCDCSSKKKRHFRKFKTPESSSRPRRSRKPYRFFRKKSSSSREFKRKQSSRCFICKRKGHYAKDCPNKREKSIRLVEHLQATTDYSPAKDELEFYFSEQDEPNDETVFALQSSSDSDSDQSQVIFHQQSLSLDTTVPIPSIKLQILPSKFQRPIPAIGLIDTGAQRSMLNPHILPSEYWTQSEEHFKAVNGKLFTTSLITKKPIGIQIFPNCVIWTKVIGSTLPNKDILLGFDILHQIKHLQIIPTGIRVKSMFKPFTDILKLYNLSETPQSYQDISTKLLSFCPESHSEFTHPNPLWKNKSFFIKLPFKLNEDINPTKATHPGMSPSDLLLAQQECSQLLAQGLIEPTSSQWACQAFYVEKHSEIVRGQKRLVIDYQPLNMFLQDDKFPLPRRQSMFTFLKNAQIFSKFDLKSGFWQLGIEPSERYKTAFCIPNAHFQWTVLPFGLKTAPSIFQKSMVQIFQPILHHALIYIDDILLFSGSHDEHRQLLTQFYDILQSHGIMLSAKKSIIATDNVEFLGMIIKDGHYQPGKHIAQELLHFPDQQLSKRQIQQFLGIINYIRDFIPHIAQNPPPLKLITDGKRILQTDASDESWGAILLEEINGKENFIAYASGHFSDTQKHYHSVFKEILAVKNGIKKFEYHLIGHHFLIRMDSSAFPNIFHFKGKTVPEKMLLRLKDWFSKYDFSVKHIKGSQNLIPDMLSRLSKPENPLTLFSTTYHFPIISMATSLPPQALTKKTFPFNKTFSSVFAIQEFARKALFRFFMKAYLVTDPFPFSTFHPENLFLTGLTLDPTRETTDDVLWYIWCLTVLYATKLILPISPTLEHLLNPDNATSLTWTLLEWFSPIPWWRRKLQQLSEIYNLDRMPIPEAQMFTSVFIIHRPYFQHPDTKLFWTQDQVYEWFTAPHIAVIENDIQDVLHNYLCQLNHQPPPLKDISHTSLGPQHDLLMIPTPSAISKPKSTGIIIKEEKPDYTDFLFQDSQDPWDAFLPLSQHLHQFPQPTMDEPGPSAPGPSTQSSKRPAQPSKVDKATQTSPKYTPKCTPRDYNCPYPPCRGPSCKHPKLSKTFFQKYPHSGDTDPNETESSSEDEYMNLRSP